MVKLVKKSVTITVDCDVWEEAGNKLDSRSEFCESQLRLFLQLDNDKEDELLQQIQDKRDEINVLEDKLCAYRKERLTNAQNNLVFADAMVSINRLNDKLGCVGKNQIKRIAKSNGVPFDLLLEHCRSCDLNIVNYGDVPKRR